MYALALERGWTAATRIEDGQLAAHVGNGLQPYRNYSRLHHGSVTLREALGNSLNIPAVKTLQFVGSERLLDRLQAPGIDGLTAHPDWYGDGLALASGGRLQRLTLFEQPVEAQAPLQLINREAASIITDILSNPRARLLAQTVRDLDGAERSEWFAPGTGPETMRSAEAEPPPPRSCCSRSRVCAWRSTRACRWRSRRWSSSCRHRGAALAVAAGLRRAPGLRRA